MVIRITNLSNILHNSTVLTCDKDHSIRVTFSICPSSGYCCSIDCSCRINVGKMIPLLNSATMTAPRAHRVEQSITY